MASTSDKQRELFENNKITEAICQFSFSNPIDLAKASDFFKLIHDKYTEHQNVPLIHVNFNLAEANPTKVELNGSRFLNDQKDKVVQLYSDNLSIHQVGNYQSWELFRADIEYVISSFASIFTCDVARIDLRTINVFNFDAPFKPSKYFEICLNYPSDFPYPINYNFSLEQVFEAGKTFGSIRGNSIQNDNQNTFILDLSYIDIYLENPIKMTVSENIKKSLELGHAKLYTIFTSVITDDTRELIK